MVLEDFHVHSTFSDGADPPEAVVGAALRLGLARLGFSDHGYAPYDTDCCIPEGRQREYREAVAALKERYRGQIDIFCGVEQDLWSGAPAEGYDYVIGSAHYLLLDGGYYTVDWRVETLREAADRFFGGDMLGVAEEYFRVEAQVYARTHCDVVGHFDLISKLNERFRLFDTAHPRYVAAWRAAADRLLADGARVFEINTGAMSRGYRTAPYPAPDICAYLRDRGARFVLSSDSHSAETLCHGFDAQRRRAEEMGLTLVRFPVDSCGN